MRGTVSPHKGFAYTIYIDNPDSREELIGTTKHRAEAVAVFSSAVANYHNDNIYLKEFDRVIDGHEPRGTIENVIEAKVHEYRCQEKEDVDNAIKRFYPKLSKERLKHLAGRSEQVELQGGFKTFLIPVEWGFYNRKEADNA